MTGYTMLKEMSEEEKVMHIFKGRRSYTCRLCAEKFIIDSDRNYPNRQVCQPCWEMEVRKK
jgi:formylmethanofuran dehydrogenase subunit E